MSWKASPSIQAASLCIIFRTASCHGDAARPSASITPSREASASKATTGRCRLRTLRITSEAAAKHRTPLHSSHANPGNLPLYIPSSPPQTAGIPASSTPKLTELCHKILVCSSSFSPLSWHVFRLVSCDCMLISSVPGGSAMRSSLNESRKISCSCLVAMVHMFHCLL